VTAAVAPEDPEVPFGPGSAPVGATASSVQPVGSAVPPCTCFTRVSSAVQVTTFVTVYVFVAPMVAV
jgi:hypothetical protein